MSCDDHQPGDWGSRAPEGEWGWFIQPSRRAARHLYPFIAQSGNFAGFTQKNITVSVNQQVRIDVTLSPASVSTQITVTEAAPELQTETAEVDSEINQTQISQLPITSSKGRNYEELYTLIPGAAQVQEKNSIGGNPSRALSVNVNGNSYNGNTTRIDGAIDYYGWLPYLIAYVTPADAVESVTVTTDDFNAEQGKLAALPSA